MYKEKDKPKSGNHLYKRYQNKNPKIINKTSWVIPKRFLDGKDPPFFGIQWTPFLHCLLTILITKLYDIFILRSNVLNKCL